MWLYGSILHSFWKKHKNGGIFVLNFLCMKNKNVLHSNLFCNFSSNIFKNYTKAHLHMKLKDDLQLKATKPQCVHVTDTIHVRFVYVFVSTSPVWIFLLNLSTNITEQNVGEVICIDQNEPCIYTCESIPTGHKATRMLTLWVWSTLWHTVCFSRYF